MAHILVSLSQQLSFGGQLITDLTPMSQVAMLELEQIGKEHAAPVSDPTKWNVLVVEKLNDVWTRHVQQVCRLLRRELRMDGRNRHRISVRNLSEHVHQ